MTIKRGGCGGVSNSFRNSCARLKNVDSQEFYNCDVLYLKWLVTGYLNQVVSGIHQSQKPYCYEWRNEKDKLKANT